MRSLALFLCFLRIKADLSQEGVYLNAELQTQALQHSHTQINLHLQFQDSIQKETNLGWVSVNHKNGFVGGILILQDAFCCAKPSSQRTLSLFKCRTSALRDRCNPHIFSSQMMGKRERFAANAKHILVVKEIMFSQQVCHQFLLCSWGRLLSISTSEKLLFILIENHAI